MNNSSWKRDLVLLGGGHSHALALRLLAMQADPQTRITLISLDSHTPYSGMLPGLLAGHYSYSDSRIDLRRLCSHSGVRFIAARANPQRQRVLHGWWHDASIFHRVEAAFEIDRFAVE